MLALQKNKNIFITLGILGAFISNPTFAAKGRSDYRVLYHGQSVDDLVIKYMEDNNIPGLSLAIVQETIARVALLVKAQGGKVFAHIDPSGEALKLGKNYL